MSKHKKVRKEKEDLLQEIQQIRGLNKNLQHEICQLVDVKAELKEEIKELKNKIKLMKELFETQQKFIFENSKKRKYEQLEEQTGVSTTKTNKL